MSSTPPPSFRAEYPPPLLAVRACKGYPPGIEPVHKRTTLWVAPGGENREHKPRKTGEAFWERWSLVLVACVTRAPAGTTPNFLQCCPHSFLSRRLGTGKVGMEGRWLWARLPHECPKAPLPCLAPDLTYEGPGVKGHVLCHSPPTGPPVRLGRLPSLPDVLAPDWRTAGKRWMGT